MIFHIDMNSYFASVEQQYNPVLRGKPVGVCAYLSKNGCIIASSREAKERGVKTGMRAQEAWQRCPEIHLVENDPKKYRATTEKIFAVLQEYSDDFEPYSIDEAFLDIPYVHTEEEGFNLGYEWNARIKKEVGEVLCSSIGFGVNHFYAKLFSDTGPKDSVTYIPPEQLDDYLASLKLEDVWGIGPRIAKRVKTMGIANPLQVKRAFVDDLITEFGKYGYELWSNLNGKRPHQSFYIKEDQTIFQQIDEYPKSVGHSYCLPLKIYNLEIYKRILYKLCERTCIRLREMKKVAYGVAFAFSPRNTPRSDARSEHPSQEGNLKNPLQRRACSARDVWGTSRSRREADGVGSFGVDTSFRRENVLVCLFPKSHASFKTTHPLSDALDLYHAILPYLERLPHHPLYMIAVSLFSLSDNKRKQLSLFDTRRGEACLASTNHRENLLESFDSINSKWGPFTIMRGAMFDTENYALERIGFRKL